MEKGWKKVENKFGVVILTSVTNLGGNFPVGGEDLSFGDGSMKLVWINSIGRLKAASVFDKVDKGVHFEDPAVFGERCRECVIEPLEKKPLMNLDGERAPLQPTYIRVLSHRGLVAV